MSLANLGEPEKIFEGSHDDEMLNYLVTKRFSGGEIGWKTRGKFVIVVREILRILCEFFDELRGNLKIFNELPLNESLENLLSKS